MTDKTDKTARTTDQRIYDIVRQIPAGQVATYGQVALVAEVGSARRVGRALAILPRRNKVPWHRVLNSQGKIAERHDGGSDHEQARRLRKEGVFLDRLGRVDFKTVAWPGPPWAWLEEQGYDVESLVLRSGAVRRKGPWCKWGF